MPKFRNIRVKMKGGKTRIQRAMVLASGKLKFVKNTGRRAARATKKQARKQARRQAKMAKGGGRRQGLVSWITSFFALLIGLFPAWRELANLFAGRHDLGGLATNLNEIYNPFGGHPERVKEGYGALFGGIIFKAATAELTRRAQIRSMIPALHA